MGIRGNCMYKKIYFILSLSLLLLIGCIDNKEQPRYGENDFLRFEAIIAYFANSGITKTNTDTQPENCKCDSDKMVKSGDGLIRVPCPCGPSCKCHKDKTGSAAAIKEVRQVVYIGHDLSCLYCRLTKKDVFPKLTSMNPPWNISEKEDASIRITEYKDDNEYEISVMPAFILFVNGKEVSRHEGYLDHIKLSKFYYSGEPSTSKPKPKGSGDDCSN